MAASSASPPALEQEIKEVEQELHQFEVKQVQDTNLLKFIVYPSLLAFIILALYGFYLVQSLAMDVHRLTNTIVAMQTDMRRMTDSVVEMQTVVKKDLNTMVLSLNSVSVNMGYVTESTQNMAYYLIGMTNNTGRMANDVQQMNSSAQNMAASMYNLQGDMGSLNQRFSSPFKMMSHFMSFSGTNQRQYVPPPPVTYYPQQSYYWPSPDNSNASTFSALPNMITVMQNTQPTVDVMSTSTLLNALQLTPTPPSVTGLSHPTP
ncbi:hypothetical protein [Thiofilum flexile]|uniref:hypothetical protein n=1 Tax=Thiofilum flexile TaxID=125627 RepID=UPI000382210C|nr:hypothetical protein [Thiofilum flexile]